MDEVIEEVKEEVKAEAFFIGKKLEHYSEAEQKRCSKDVLEFLEQGGTIKHYPYVPREIVTFVR